MTVWLEALYCWNARRSCLIAGSLSLVGNSDMWNDNVWWLILGSIAVSYGALGDEQSSKEIYLEVFDDGAGASGTASLLFFPVSRVSFYVTVKLAFWLAFLMALGSGALVTAAVWRLRPVCLVYPATAVIGGSVEIIVLLVYWKDPPVPSLWFLSEAYVAFLALCLYKDLKYSRPVALEETPKKDTKSGPRKPEPVLLGVEAVKEPRFSKEEEEDQDRKDATTGDPLSLPVLRVDEEVQAERHRHHHHHHHHHHHDCQPRDQVAAGAEEQQQLDINENNVNDAAAT